MDRLVDIVAPKGKLDFLFKLFLFLFAIGTLNWLRDIAMLGGIGRGAWVNYSYSAFVGTPFVAFGLVLFKHQRTLQQRLAVLASTDVLTGLPNRRAFLDAARETLPKGGVFLMIDVDHFKSVNDTYGHAIGDLCLVAIADHIRKHTPDTAISGRLGGEEFAAFLPSTDRNIAATTGRALAEGVAVSVDSPHGPIALTVSVGAYVVGSDNLLRDVMSRADHALYAAKTNGRAQCVIWGEPTKTEMQERLN